MRELSPAELAQLDGYILRSNRLGGIQFLRELLALSLREGYDLFCQRYDELRRTRGDEFEESHEEYWEGFSS